MRYPERSERSQPGTGEHLLPTSWYPFALVAELIQVAYRDLLRRREEAALQMGIADGTYALGTYHKTLVKPGDPRASVLGGDTSRLVHRVAFK